MTALIINAGPDEATVAMDTLVTDGRDPVGYSTKLHYLPTIRTIFACTGAHGLVDAWMTFVNVKLQPKGIEALRDITPQALGGCWKSMRETFNAPEGMTTTMYHVGFSERSDEMLIHVFRSTNDFVAETLSLGFYNRPEIDEFPALPDGALSEKIVGLMKHQQALQAGIPKDQRIHVGGLATVVNLTRTGASTFVAGSLDN